MDDESERRMIYIRAAVKRDGFSRRTADRVCDSIEAHDDTTVVFDFDEKLRALALRCERYFWQHEFSADFPGPR